MQYKIENRTYLEVNRVGFNLKCQGVAHGAGGC